MTFKQQTSSNLPKVFLLSQLLVITLTVLIACTSNNMVTAQQQKVQQPFVGVSTFARRTSNGDGLPASEGALSEPRFTKFLTNNGDYYIADGNRIRKVSSSDGLISTIAGGGTLSKVDGIPAINAQLNEPTCIDVHPTTGELYIVDSGNSRICKVSKDGIISTVVGSLQGPRGLAFHPITGELYFTQMDIGKISKINSQNYTNIETVAGTGTEDSTPDTGLATSVQLNSPYQLVFSPSGDRLYFTDRYVHKIRMIHTINNTIETIAGTGNTGSDNGPAVSATFDEPSGLALDSGELYIVDEYNQKIRKLHLASGMVTTFAGSGYVGVTGDGGQAINARFQYPGGVSFRSTLNGNYIVIADTYNYRIRQVSLSTNVITKIAGGRVGDGYQANKYGQLDAPMGISKDSNGNYIIADTYNGRVRSVSATTGIISTIVGTGIREYNGDGLLPTDTSLNTPTSVVTDSRNGDIYICDFDSFRIRKISKANGTMSTIFGTGNSDYTPDGTIVSDSVSTGYIYTIAINSMGEIIFCDYYNHVIRKIMTNGTLVTIAGTPGEGGYSGDGGLAINAKLYNPNGVFVDPTNDDIYIVDLYNYRYRKVFNNNGTIVTVVGSGVQGSSPDGTLATECSLYYPAGITIDPLNGDLYFIDRYQVKKVFGVNGTVVTIAGVVDGGNSDGDGGPAINAKFGELKGIFLETNTGGGNGGGDMPTIYVSDTTSVRKISQMCPSMYVLNGTECFPTCSGIISTNTQLVCSGRGQCNEPNNCTCSSSNYYGSNCELFDCWGISVKSTQVCSSHGLCQSPNQCSCSNGYYGSNCELYNCSGITFNESNVCSSHGSCQSPNQCSCSNGYYGSNCELFNCSGIDSNSTQVCSSNGTCAGPDRCECTSSLYYGTNCEQFNCFNINSFNTSVVCSGNGVCTSPDVCVCKNGFKGVKCDQKIVIPPVAASSGGSDRPLPPGKCVTIGNSTICSESSMTNTTSHLTIIVALIVMMGILSAF